MLKKIILFGLAICLAGTVSAQKGGKSPKKADKKQSESVTEDNENQHKGVLCSNPSRKGLKTLVTPDGLEYFFYKKSNGRKPRLGDILTLHITTKNHKDSVIGTTRTAGNPIKAKVQAARFKGAVEDGFLMLSPGDSVVFFVSIDSVLRDMPQDQWPPFVKTHTKLAYEIVVFDISTEEELKEKEKQTLISYCKKSGYQPIITQSGLVYGIITQGTGVQARAGDQVSVHYTGKLLNGKKFDSSVDRGQPFEFKLGAGNVIKGWDEGIALLKEGTKALLVIPSRLGYGERGAGQDIPPDSPLAFEVELIKTTPPAPPKEEKTVTTPDNSTVAPAEKPADQKVEENPKAKKGNKKK